MPTKEQRAAKIERIASCPRALHDAVKGLSDEQLDTPYRDGGWTCRQVVHHVADSHMNAFARFRWVITEDNTTIKTYDQDMWANLPDMKMPLAPSFSIIDGLHQRWATFLSALPDDAWSRKATHPEHGEINLDGLLDIYAEHGHNHAKQITDLRARNGW
jgi:hypothetical protein